MKKWTGVLLIAILFAGIVANGFLYVRQTAIVHRNEALTASLQSDLNNLKDMLSLLDGNIQTIGGGVSSLTTAVADLQTDVTAVTGNVSSLSASLNSLQRTVQESGGGLVTDFTSAVDTVRPSVVIIDAQVVTTVFPGRRVTQQVSGSGWIINSDGLIVTNSHVVADAISIRVSLADGRSFPSIGVRTDPSTDLAIVKIDARGLPVASTGDSGTLKVGQPVAAIGNALGLGTNMSGGWVSRLNASITLSDGSRLSGLIGTDAAINPGNSGGPLINAKGEVVGITSAKLTGTGVEGIGYAISINSAMSTINNLIARL